MDGGDRMNGSERSGVEAWLLPEDSKPPLFSELVERVDEALAIARSSEAAVVTVGAAALDAAEQARRAAELAERASVRAFGPRQDDNLQSFSERADRVAARLNALGARAPSAERRPQAAQEEHGPLADRRKRRPTAA